MAPIHALLSGTICVLIGAATCAPLTALESFSIRGRPAIKDFLDNCPYHPDPVDLPGAIPDQILTALTAVDGILTSVLDPNVVPGIAASITYRDRVIYSKGFGTIKKGTAVPPTSETLFRIASVSKIFVVITIYQLFERGLVSSLDDPFVKYCPGFSINNIYNSQDITLRQMLAQMSGLPRISPCVNSTADILCIDTTAEILEGLKSEILIHPPWSLPSYSNLAYSLLGRCVLENVVPGTSYEDYVTANILTPLGMNNTGFNITESIAERMAVGYNSNDGSVATLYSLGWDSPSGQMYSNIDDMNKMLQFFNGIVVPFAPRKDSTVLSEDLRREMMLPLFVNPDGYTGFGTPWEIAFLANYTILTKSGNIGGYSSFFTVVPDLLLGMNLLFTGGPDLNQIAPGVDIYVALIPAMVEVLRTIQPVYPYPPDPSVYTGQYGSKDGLINVTIYDDGIHLFVSGLDIQTVYLSYQKQYYFQVEFPLDTKICIATELQGLYKQWLVFNPPAQPGGPSTSCYLPGLYPAEMLYRID
ncbi:hypothetical protein EMCRGX_G018414 [Ephydatia muelleri]